MFQGGRSRNFRIAQGLQFIAAPRRVPPEPNAFLMGETDAGFATNAAGRLGAMALTKPDLHG
jgi:hypothetical protein